MPSSLWKGAITFGLVSVPVGVYSAKRDTAVKFKQINSKTGHLVGQKRVDKVTGDEVAWDDIAKGYEVSPDHFVTFTQEEVKGLAKNKDSTIELSAFVDLADIDPLLYDKSYYLGAQKGAAGAYRLLAKAMKVSKKVGIGKIIMHGREHVCALRTGPSDVLIMATISYADEVLPAHEYSVMAGEVQEPAAAALTMAKQLVTALKGAFDLDAYENEYQKELVAMVEARVAGGTIAMPDAKESTKPVPDLMAALQASLDAMEQPEPKPKSKTSVKAKPTLKQVA